MEKVYLQFKTKNDLLNFLEYANNPLCVVDAENNRILCELSEKDIAYAQKKCRAIVLPDSSKNTV